MIVCNCEHVQWRWALNDSTAPWLTQAFELNDTVVGPPPEVQWDWLEGVLNRSTADYLFVGGQ
jgi:hypothetical protein